MDRICFHFGFSFARSSSLILNSLDDTNSISLTNNNSPSNGLKLDGGSVNITSLTINSATNDYLIHFAFLFEIRFLLQQFFRAFQ